MQSRPVRRLAAKLRSERRRKKPKSYRRLSLDYGILSSNGTPNPGLVKNIIDGFEPTDPDTRRRIHLPPLDHCPHCLRKLKVSEQRSHQAAWRRTVNDDLLKRIF